MEEEKERLVDESEESADEELKEQVVDDVAGGWTRD